jgi:hypothetical protein
VKKKIFLAVLVAAAAPFFFFSVESDKLRAKMERMAASSGFAVKIGSAGFRLPASITLSDVSVEKNGTFLNIPRINISVSIVRFIAQDPFVVVSLKEPSFDIADFSWIPQESSPAGGLPLGLVKIENGSVRYEGAGITRARGDFSFRHSRVEGLLKADALSGRMVLRLTGKSGDVRAALNADNLKLPGSPAGAPPIKLSAKGRIDDDKITAHFKVSSGELKIRGEGDYRGGNYNFSAEWEGLSESYGAGSAEIKGDISGLRFAVKSPAANVDGFARFERGGVAVETSTAAIRFVSRDFSVDGEAAVKGFWASGGRSSAAASFSGRTAIKDAVGRLKIDAVQKGDSVRIDAALSPSGARAALSIDIGGGIEGTLSDGKKGRASLRGTFAPLDITFSADDWNAAAISSSAIPVAGRFGASGSLTGSGGEWLLAVRARAVDAVWNGFNLGSCSADITAGPKLLAVTDASLSGGRIKGYYKSVKGVSTELKAVADEADMGVLSLLARRRVAGRLTGRLEISTSGEKPPYGKADITVRGLAVDGRALGELKASGFLDGRDIAFDKFSLMGPDGSLSGGFSVIGSKVTGLFGFGAYAVAGNMKATGQISVSGRYKTIDDFSLSAQSKKMSLAGFMHGDAPLLITAHSDSSAYKISELRYGHLHARDITVKKTPAGELSGVVTLNDYPLSILSNDLKGSCRADGTLYGALSSPKLKVAYKADGVEFSTHVPAARLSGSGVYSDGVFRISESKVSQPRAQAVFGGSVTAENIDVSGKITASGISGIVAVDGLTSGPLAMNFGVTGKPSSPVVDISGEIADFSYGGAVADKIKLASRYDTGKISFSESSIRFGGNEIKILPGSSYDIGAGLYDIKLLVVSLRAGILSALGRLGVSGKIPTATSPAAGALRLDDFWIGGKKFTRSELLYEISDKRILLASPAGKSESFRAEAGFAADSVAARINYAGSAGDSAVINLDSRAGVLAADGNLVSFSVDTISSMLDSPLEASGSLNATVKLSGSAGNPALEARAVVYSGSVSGIMFDEVSAEATLNDGVLDLVSARAVKANAYRLSAAGRLYVAPPADKTRRRGASLRNDFTVTLDDGRLSFLEAFDFVKKAEGPVTGRMEIRGTLDEPKLTGFLKIENATAELSAYLAKINNLNLIATLKENALTVENFSGRSGSGRFLLQGAARIENFAFADVDFTFKNTTSVGIDLFVPELPIPTQFSKETGAKFASSHSNGKPRFEISIKGDPRSKFTLGGWVKLDHTYFSYPPPPPLVSEDPARHILEKLYLDLTLQTGENTWYENELVSVNIEGSMTLKGNYYGPFVTGSVESKRGYISYIGNEFRIQSARFEVSGADAYLEGSASKQMATSKGYDTVQVIIDRSLIGRLQPRFVSSDDPSLPSEKVFARIVGGDSENMTPQDRDLMLRQGLVRLLDSSLATPFARTLLRRSGVVDIMKVSYAQPTVSDPDTAPRDSSETLPELLRGTKYTFEKYVSDAMLLGYSVTLDEYLNKLDLKHEVEVAYRMKGNVFLRGIYELDSKSLIRPPERRITIEQQWRFGWPKKQ